MRRAASTGNDERAERSMRNIFKSVLYGYRRANDSGKGREMNRLCCRTVVSCSSPSRLQYSYEAHILRRSRCLLDSLCRHSLHTFLSVFISHEQWSGEIQASSKIPDRHSTVVQIVASNGKSFVIQDGKQFYSGSHFQLLCKGKAIIRSVTCHFDVGVTSLSFWCSWWVWSRKQTDVSVRRQSEMSSGCCLPLTAFLLCVSRNGLFEVSGVRAKYPQFFLVNHEGVPTYGKKFRFQSTRREIVVDIFWSWVLTISSLWDQKLETLIWLNKLMMQVRFLTLFCDSILQRWHGRNYWVVKRPLLATAEWRADGSNWGILIVWFYQFDVNAASLWRDRPLNWYVIDTYSRGSFGKSQHRQRGHVESWSKK